MDWEYIVMLVLAVLGGAFVVKWGQVKSLIKEVAEALSVLSEAIEDDNLTREELKKITDEFQDVILAALKLGKK